MPSSRSKITSNGVSGRELALGWLVGSLVTSGCCASPHGHAAAALVERIGVDVKHGHFATHEYKVRDDRKMLGQVELFRCRLSPRAVQRSRLSGAHAVLTQSTPDPVVRSKPA